MEHAQYLFSHFRWHLSRTCMHDMYHDNFFIRGHVHRIYLYALPYFNTSTENWKVREKIAGMRSSKRSTSAGSSSVARCAISAPAFACVRRRGEAFFHRRPPRWRESYTILGKHVGKRHAFKFDKVFAPTTGHDMVFEAVLELVQSKSTLDGYYVCLFS